MSAAPAIIHTSAGPISAAPFPALPPAGPEAAPVAPAAAPAGPRLPRPVVWPPVAKSCAPPNLDVRAMLAAYPNPARLREVADLLDAIYSDTSDDPAIQQWLRERARAVEMIVEDPAVKAALEDQERREQS